MLNAMFKVYKLVNPPYIYAKLTMITDDDKLAGILYHWLGISK